MPIIALRIYKTGIAAGLAFLISQLIGTRSPFFGIIAAVIVMQPTVYETIIKSKERIIGTIIGILVGVVFVFAMVSLDLKKVFLLEKIVGSGLIMLGIIVVLGICHIFKLKGSAIIAPIAFAFMVTRVDNDQVLLNALHRIVDTTIGTICAIGVNCLLFKEDSQK